MLHTAIKSLSVEVKAQTEQIRELRNTIEQTIRIKTDTMTVENLIEKYEITLKLKSIYEFQLFEKKLTTNTQFFSDFVSF